MGGTQLVRLHQRDDVLDVSGDRKFAHGGGAAGALQIGANHVEVARQGAGLGPKGVRRAPETVHHDERVALTVALDR